MGSTELCVVGSRSVQAQLAVDSEANFRRIGVFLSVVFPPADRAELEGSGRFKSLVSAAWTAIASVQSCTPSGLTRKAGPDGLPEPRSMACRPSEPEDDAGGETAMRAVGR